MMGTEARRRGMGSKGAGSRRERKAAWESRGTRGEVVRTGARRA